LYYISFIKYKKPIFLRRSFMKMRRLMTIFILLSLTVVVVACTQGDSSPEKPVDVPVQEKETQTRAPIEEPSATPTTQEPVPEDLAPETPSEPQVTSAELATHNKEGDCWIAYKGEVFDVTSYLPRHPGGVGAIKQHCGTSDSFEEAFTDQHGTSKVGTLKKQGLYKGVLV
jgi:hypothetical protein